MVECLILGLQEYSIIGILYLIIEFGGNDRASQKNMFFKISTTGRLFVLHLRDPFLASISGSKGHFAFGVRTISHCFLFLKLSGKDNEIVRMQLQEFK